MLLPFLEGLTVDEAIKTKRLYYVDHKVMDNLPCKNDRIVPALLALFFVNREKKLPPVATQLFQNPSKDNPVFLQSDNMWILANMWFQNPDAMFHRSCAKFGFTHLIMESFNLATHRSLSMSYPVFRLLAPHFMHLPAINALGMSVLLSPEGWVDVASTVGSAEMSELMVPQLCNWRLDVQSNLLKDLKDRGVEDQESLPNYYYPDDTMLT